MKHIGKCVVKDCGNHTNEGLFVGLLCSPCHAFISGDGGLYSQAYRNSRVMIDIAIQMEREACAALCDAECNKEDPMKIISTYESGCYMMAEFLANEIRSRK